MTGRWEKIMWNRTKALAVCMFAVAWWGVFYPELCFTEETCEAVQTGETVSAAGGKDDGETAAAGGKDAGRVASAGQMGAGESVSGGQIDAGEIWRADSGGLVISSRFLEWCEECLTAGKE